MLRARESFFAFLDGAEVPVVAGQTFPDDHPAVAGREHLFEAAAPAAEELPRQQDGKASSSRRRTRKA